MAPLREADILTESALRTRRRFVCRPYGRTATASHRQPARAPARLHHVCQLLGVPASTRPHRLPARELGPASATSSSQTCLPPSRQKIQTTQGLLRTGALRHHPRPPPSGEEEEGQIKIKMRPNNKQKASRTDRYQQQPDPPATKQAENTDSP